MREINLNKQVELIVNFIQAQLSSAGFSKLIVGLSGGIDSSV
ncbi:MAG: NAD(+) synthetase, partial [FCB group bacterium]|nr:NAD(+) synthetase [FCB group bacterium]